MSHRSHVADVPSLQWKNTNECQQECEDIFQRYRLLHLRNTGATHPEARLHLLEYLSKHDLADHWTAESSNGSIKVAMAAMDHKKNEDWWGPNWDGGVLNGEFLYDSGSNHLPCM